MSGSIGGVYYDVEPAQGWEAAFAAKVQAGLGGAKPVKIKVEADTKAASAASSKLATQQSAIAQRSEAQLRAIRERGAQQSRILTQRTAAQQAAAQARATASAERGAARQTAVAQRAAERQAVAAERGAARQVAATERAAAKEAAARTRAAAVAERAQARETAAAERSATRQAAARNGASSKLGGGLLKGGALSAAAIGLVVTQEARFEKAVSNTASTSAEAAANIGSLRNEAIKYGASTAFSATEAASAQAELIKANVSVTDTINGGLKGALDLAAAGSLEVGDAAGIMATAMSQFNIPGTQASHVADLLAAAAGKAQGEVADFAGALKYAGPVAKSSGVSIEETTGVLAEFANQGILGEQAGTSLRSMLVSLTAPIGEGAKALDKYGISTRDAKGNFIGLEGAAGQLRAKLGGLPKAERDAALARIFGKNSLTAATVLYDGGAESVKKWTDAVNDSGFAQRTASTKMDNLSGDVEKLGGAFQSAFIGAASSTDGPLRKVTQGLTGLVDAYNDTGSAFKGGSFIGVGLAASAAIGVGGVLKLGGALRGAKTLAADLGTSLKSLSLKGGAVGLGLAAVAAIVGTYAVKSAEAKARTDDLTTSLLASKGAIDGNIASTRAKSLEDSGALKAAQTLGISIDDVTQASLGNVDAQERVNAALDKGQRAANQQKASNLDLGTSVGVASDKTSELADAQDKVREAVGGGTKELRAAQAAYDRQSTAANAAAAGQAAVAAAADDVAPKLREAAAAAADVGTKSALSASDVKTLTDSLFGESDAATSALNATIAYNDAVEAAGKSKSGGLSTKSDSGQANIALLEKEAGALKEKVKQKIAEGDSEKSVLKFYKAGRDELVKHANAMSDDKGQVKDRTDALLETPDEIKTKYEVITEANQKAKLDDLTAKLGSVPPEVATRVQALVDAGNFSAAADQLNSLASQREAGINVVTNGADVAAGNIGEAARDRRAAIDVSANGVGGAKGAIDNAAKNRNTKIAVNDSGTASADKAISNAAKGRGSRINVSAAGVGAANSAINSAARPRSTTITVYKKTMTSADQGKGATGGTYTDAGFVGRGPKGYSIGGSVWGAGTSTSDSINARLANGEEVIRTKQAIANRAILKRINAGGVWDLTPRMRRAEGGDTSSAPARATSDSGRVRQQVVVNVDLGSALGGVRRIVADEVSASGEYAATLTRMGGH